MNEQKKEYSICSVTGEPEWSTIPVLQIDRILWKPDCGIRGSGQLCHDDEHLFIHLRASEANIRAEYTAPLSPVCRDSCLEFFFMPENEDRYFNFEINPKGCLYIGFGHGREDSTALYREDMKQLFGIRTERTPEGWEVFYRIPMPFLRLFLPGFSFTGALRANAYKCGDLTEHEHYLAWNPIVSETPDFHRPQDFGLMRFE
jgi:hypothetical protein